MYADLSKYKVVYEQKVLNAVSLEGMRFPNNTDFNEVYKKPDYLDIVVINEDGNIECIRDEAFKFQFVPIISR